MKEQLFDKKYVHTIWKDELDGKTCFVADTIDALKHAVNAGHATANTKIYKLDKNNNSGQCDLAPFLSFTVKSSVFYNISSIWRFAYYDPNYELKKAFLLEHRQIQACLKDNETDVDTIWSYKELLEKLDGKYNFIIGERIDPKIIKAFKQGDKIEYRRIGSIEWQEFSKATSGDNYFFKDDTEYRIANNSQDYNNYKPLDNTDELIAIWYKKTYLLKQELVLPTIWIKRKEDRDEKYIITGFTENGVYISSSNKLLSMSYLFESFIFLDNSPIGKLK